MEIVKRLYLEKTEKESFQKTPCVIAMGTFDGLHKGHRDVIDAAAAYARKNRLRLAVFTFSNHPYAAIRPSAIPQALISPEEKVRLLKRWGVDLLIDVPFNRQLSLLSPEEFLQKLKQFNFSCLVCGTNFTYGFRGTGNTEILKESGKEDGFDVIVILCGFIGLLPRNDVSLRRFGNQTIIRHIRTESSAAHGYAGPFLKATFVTRKTCWAVSAASRELYTKVFNGEGRWAFLPQTCM